MADQGTMPDPVDPFAASRYVGRCRDVRTGEPIDVLLFPRECAEHFERPAYLELQTRDGVLLRVLRDDLMQALADAGEEAARSSVVQRRGR